MSGTETRIAKCARRIESSTRRLVQASVLAVFVLLAGCSTTRPQPVVIAPPPAPPPPPVAVWEPPPYIPWGEHTVETRLNQFGAAARSRWQTWFDEAGVRYPGNAVVFVGLKDERRLQVYAGPSWAHLTFIRDFAWTATSGRPGPKLREGDRQIPEGIYAVESLNPNSRFHVSLRLGYPNAFDRSVAAREGRTKLGGDIMIHGGDRSIGCVAVGDQHAEDLFVLAADVGVDSIDVVLAPRDFRNASVHAHAPTRPAWVRDLYARIDEALRSLPPPTITTVTR